MSESIEMYLISIARIAETTHDETVPIPRLAEKLSILPVSTNQMIRKLEETGVVNYLPYKGIQQTNCLKFPIETAYSLSCRLEHVMSNEEIEHLSQFLGDPTLNVNGIPLQPPLDNQAAVPEFPLTRLKVNQAGYVVRVAADQALLSFLSSAGIWTGVRVTSIAKGDSGDMLVLVGDKSRIHLSPEVAAHIWLRGH